MIHDTHIATACLATPCGIRATARRRFQEGHHHMNLHRHEISGLSSFPLVSLMDVN